MERQIETDRDQNLKKETKNENKIEMIED